MSDDDLDNDAIPAEIREKLALALDVDDLVAATRLVGAVGDYFGVVKIGLELYAAGGPDVIGAFTSRGYDVFLDLKLHDIPTTVHKASRVLGALGVRMVTMHAHGGVDMLRAGVEGLAEGASNAGLPAPDAIAVTVLTSDKDAPDHIVPKRVRTAVEGGCAGVVCAAADLQDVYEYAPRIKRVVPGIRLPGTQTHDQAKAATPSAAIEGGADLLVIGRAITAAKDPIVAAEELVSNIL